MDKLSLLLKSGRILLHTQDLALLWGIQNRHNLRITISRYIKRGILFKIFKGLYSTTPIDQIDRHQLGPILVHRFCYLSCEPILEEYGVINHKVFPLIYVSSVSKRIELNGSFYVYKQMKAEFLLNPEGVILKDGLYKASLERAVADIQYFNMNVYYDSPSLIDWERVKDIKERVGY